MRPLRNVRRALDAPYSTCTFVGCIWLGTMCDGAYTRLRILKNGETVTASHRYDPSSPESILTFARRLVGKSLREMITDELARLGGKGKGCFGDDLAELYFGLPPGDNKSEPDFREAGVELKSSGLLRRKKGLTAKERTSLAMIPATLQSERWETSSLLHKCGTILFVFYEFEDGVHYLDRTIRCVGLWEMPRSGELRDDWLTIQTQAAQVGIRQLSCKMTKRLEAAPKDQGNKDTPENERKPSRRAFALKAGTVTELVLPAMDWSVPVFDGELSFDELGDALSECFRPYIGLSAPELRLALGVATTPKSLNFHAAVTKAVLGVEPTQGVRELENQGVAIRSIRLDWGKQSPKEHVSFPHFKYLELVKESWDTSTLRETLLRPILFVVYRAASADNDRYILSGVRLWRMPLEDLDGEVRRVWQLTIDRINSGAADKLPASADSPICHVRPHGRDGSDTLPTPANGPLVKSSFWLRNRYIGSAIRGVGTEQVRASS